MQADFRTALARLRESQRPQRLSISDQLRLLDDVARDPSPEPPPLSMMTLPDGREQRTEAGTHYVVREIYRDDYVHGRIHLNGADAKTLTRLLHLAGIEHEVEDRDRIAFLDTETTGVHGGTGMCPFLIGVGFFRGDTFQVVQFFMRDFDEESSMLLAVKALLGEFDLLVTYNGRTFDVPLMESRSILSRLDSPFEHMVHFDMLFMARRLWRAGHGSCRLTALEREILGYRRGPDIPGAWIPRAYFEFLASSNAITMRSVFTHHVADIVSLAGLMLAAGNRVQAEPAPNDTALDVYSLGRLFDRAHDYPRCTRCYEVALEAGLPRPERVRAMERLSVLYRRAGKLDQSMALCGQLMVLDEFSMAGYEGAAIFEEHHRRDLTAASRVIADALDRLDREPDSPARRERLHRRLRRVSAKATRARPQPRIPQTKTDSLRDRPARA